MTPHSTTDHWLCIRDWSADQLNGLLTLSGELKRAPLACRALEGKTIAMIFHKASTRTRVSFEVGTAQLGGHALMISASSSQIGRGEPICDSARVLSRYVDGIMIRTFAHQDLIEWSGSSAVPIINGLTDLYHPCQVLADLLTIRESLHFGDRAPWGDLRVAWVGDGNNMAHSWIEAAATLGFSLTLVCPEGFEPDDDVMSSALQRGARVTLTQDPQRGVEGAHVVTTDVWASMGQEEEAQQRLEAFAHLQVNAALMSRADTGAIFLHCLPAHRGEEVSEDVLEGPQSRVWDEAENRLHVQKALLAHLVGGVALTWTARA